VQPPTHIEGAAGSLYATHVSEMLGNELLREAVEWEKTHPAERYYESNFPVFRSEEWAECRTLCEMSKEVVTLFEEQRQKMERAFISS
jgi:hypothetical protein